MARLQHPQPAPVELPNPRPTSTPPPSPRSRSNSKPLSAPGAKPKPPKTGKPAFIVFGDQALTKLVAARPRTLAELLQVSGFGPDKVDRYGAELCALCRDEQPALESPTSRNGVPHVSPLRRGSEAPRTAPAPPTARVPHVSPLRRGNADSPIDQSSEPQTFHRDRTQTDPSASLTPGQRILEERLRTWRKAESERMGLPQFFVLGTSALREIVLEHPRTLKQLQSIHGIGQEKLDRFGPSILEVCNS